MATIDTLASDIKGLFTKESKDDEVVLSEDVMAKFGAAAATAVARSMRVRDGQRKPKTLYFSEVGKPCKRQLWYGVHYPELAEDMLGHTKYKFLYGDLIEEVTLLLAEAAGHRVEMRQHPLEIEIGKGWVVRGRIDAIIDGVLVDVKSCSPYGYDKFKEGLTDENDSFGYRAQLSGYSLGLDTVGINHSGRAFLAIDKQNGHVGLFKQPYTTVVGELNAAVDVLEDPLTEPPRKFATVTEGTSGNEKLCVECSYCSYKEACWRDANGGAGLRTFAYASRPVFLARVVKEPRVMEIAPDPNKGATQQFLFSQLQMKNIPKLLAPRKEILRAEKSVGVR